MDRACVSARCRHPRRCSRRTHAPRCRRLRYVRRRLSAQFSLRCLKIGLRCVVLQFARNFGLLSLCTAAPPYGSTPRPGCPEGQLTVSCWAVSPPEQRTPSTRHTHLTRPHFAMRLPPVGWMRDSEQLSYRTYGATHERKFEPPRTCSRRPRWQRCSVSTRRRFTRWAKAGKLSCVKTLGGHRRYLAKRGQRAAGRRTDSARTRQRTGGTRRCSGLRRVIG